MDYVGLFGRLSRLLFKLEDEKAAMAFKEQCTSLRLCAVDVAAIVSSLESDYDKIRDNRALFIALSDLEVSLSGILNLLRWCNDTRSAAYAVSEGLSTLLGNCRSISEPSKLSSGMASREKASKWLCSLRFALSASCLTRRWSSSGRSRAPCRAASRRSA